MVNRATILIQASLALSLRQTHMQANRVATVLMEAMVAIRAREILMEANRERTILMAPRSNRSTVHMQASSKGSILMQANSKVGTILMVANSKALAVLNMVVMLTNSRAAIPTHVNKSNHPAVEVIQVGDLSLS